jgi:transcriptional regulator with XRE-family HTH domain
MAASDNSIVAVIGLLIRFYGPRRPPPSPLTRVRRIGGPHRDQLLGAGSSPGRRAQLRPGLLIEDVFLGRRTAADKHGRFFMFTRLQKKSPNPVDKHVGSRVRMRRMMIAMSQEKLGAALGLTFQQVLKYEKGMNRIGASRLQQISHILQVPVAFFFEGAPNLHGSTDGMKKAPSPSYVSDFLVTRQGLSLSKAFMRINEPKLRRRIVDLVEEIAGEDD